jgi:hypothetical protein
MSWFQIFQLASTEVVSVGFLGFSGFSVDPLVISVGSRENSGFQLARR